MWFAIFDFQFDKQEFLKNSKLYEIGLKSKCYGTKVFWQWFSLGALQACVLLYICLYAEEVSLKSDGSVANLWPSGVLIYTGVVLIANFKIQLAFNNVNIFGVILVILSVLLFVLFVLAESAPSLKLWQMIGVFPQVFGDPISYFALAFLLLFVYAFDVVAGYFGDIIDQREAKKESVHVVTFEADYTPIEDARMDYPYEEKHTGYAFSEENHANPNLQAQVRKVTTKRLSQS